MVETIFDRNYSSLSMVVLTSRCSIKERKDGYFVSSSRFELLLRKTLLSELLAVLLVPIRL